MLLQFTKDAAKQVIKDILAADPAWADEVRALLPAPQPELKLLDPPTPDPTRADVTDLAPSDPAASPEVPGVTSVAEPATPAPTSNPGPQTVAGGAPQHPV
jgi:hypothetical protein